MAKSKLLLLNCALVMLCLFAGSSVFAQIYNVGPDRYVQGTSLEYAVDGLGGYEGVDITASPVPAGMHWRSGNQLFGFVANPQLNGWAGSAWDGDFFTPGSPENGWGIEIGTAGTHEGNNCAYLQQINGAFTGESTIFNCYNIDWEGDLTSGTDLHFHINYFLQQSDLYYTTTVTITNNTAATIPDLYYYRNVDPDNNEPISFTFTTNQTLVSQPGTGCDLAHVSAVMTTPWNSYLGFAAVGANWRADYGGFSNRDASDLWNGVGFTQTVGATNTADEAISLAYRIQNLAPGASETFKFLVILDATQANNAVNNTLYFTYPGSASAPPAVCTPWSDTVRTCGGPVPININGPIVSDYTWTWSPTTGLSPSTGPTVVANPGVTTTYVATGTPLTACVNPVTLTFVCMVTPGGGSNPYIQPAGPFCVTDAPYTFVVDSAGGSWSTTCGSCLNSTTGVFDPGVAGAGTYQITYTTTNTCNSTDTMMVTVSGSDPTIAPTTPVCANAAAFTMTAASTGGTWGAPCGTCISSSGSFDPSLSGAGTWPVTYTIAGTCTAIDTEYVVVNPVTPPITGFSYTTPVCISDPNPTPIPVAGFTTGGTYSSTPAGLGLNSTTGNINLSATTAGTYTVTYSYPATTCGPAGSSTATITVNPLTIPTLGFSYPTVCVSDTADATPVGVTGFTTGGVYSSTPGLAINGTTGVVDVNGSTAGTYTVTYSVTGSPALCTASGTNTATITINPLPVILMSPNNTVFLGVSSTIWSNVTNGAGAGFIWTPTTDLVCPTCDTTTATPSQTTTYCVVATLAGCIDSACTIVNVEVPCPNNRDMGVPNAFTPNNDGVNDKFCLDGWSSCVKDFQIVIFDRWGEKVFESKDPAFCWDGVYQGKALDPAVFVYYIKANYYVAGATPESPKGKLDVNRTGNISLVR
ncbi:MAG: gliding motility-associated C-terminal domain-containing protein [Bacteroidia bacterium]